MGYVYFRSNKSAFYKDINTESKGDEKMTHNLYGIRNLKMNGRDGALTFCVIHPGDILSGYMSPKIHRELRRTERSRKRRML